MIQRPKLYSIFIITFVTMHGTGVLASRLPYILNAVVTASVVLSTLALLETWYSKRSPCDALRTLGFRYTRIDRLIPGIVITLLLLLFYPVFGKITNADVHVTDDWCPNLVGLSLTAGLAEEVFFRGFVFGHLREQMTFKKAALESLVLFSLTHFALFGYLDWTIALFSTILAIGSSIPMAYLFERGNSSIWGPALVHTTIRTIGLVVTTSETLFSTMVRSWIVASLVIPYIVLAFYADFRSVWRSQTLKPY